MMRSSPRLATLALPALLAGLALSVLAWQLSGAPSARDAAAAVATTPAITASPSLTATPTVIRLVADRTPVPAAPQAVDAPAVVCGEMGATCLYLPLVQRQPPGAPATPILVAYQPTAGTVNLVWGSAGAVGYRLYRGSGTATINGQPTLVNPGLIYAGTATQATETLPAGDYYYQLQASNAQGATVSAIVKVTVEASGVNSSYPLLWAQVNVNIATSKQSWDVMAKIGNDPVNLTPGSDADEIDAAWSKDQQYVAYASNKDGHFEIYRMKADGSEKTRLTQTATTVNSVQPTWSPDGQQIAFTSDAGTFNTLDIYVIDAFPSAAPVAVTDDIRLTWPNPPPTVAPTPTQPTPTPSPTSTPAASPTPTVGPTVSVIDNYLRQTTSRLPSWSPDGGYITFVSNRAGHDEIYIMRADGRNQERLTYSTGENSAPRWSPDGQRIAFMSSRDGNWEVYTIRADGLAETRMTTNPAADSQPSWASSSEALVFITTRNGRNDFYALAIDGSLTQPLLIDSKEHMGPSWSP